ncbi:hypothetical protein NQZ79_g7140 [Umbelopsis isabellina]|nr:hypothetical protein NQZ79_g7140 [Umbelopsis isabellina]
MFAISGAVADTLRWLYGNGKYWLRRQGRTSAEMYLETVPDNRVDPWACPLGESRRESSAENARLLPIIVVVEVASGGAAVCR